MATASELVIAEELEPLREVATARGWQLEVVDRTTFTLAVLAKDGSWIHLLVDCVGYPAQPPAWHFRNPQTRALDQPPDIPIGGGFLHGAGVVCAPWNRLAYKTHDPRGPHGDWVIGDWRSNSNTRGTTSLCAMALRIAVELQGSYQRRQE